MTATAQIAISANDGKSALNDGTPQLRAPPKPLRPKAQTRRRGRGAEVDETDDVETTEAGVLDEASDTPEAAPVDEPVTDTEVEVFSPQSPLGAAVVGATKGQTVSYEAPTGKTIEVTVLDFKVYTG